MVDKDLAAGGSLISYGVTLGAGATLNIGSSVKQELPIFMPYLAVFPAVWMVRGDATRAYCTGRFLKGSREAARKHADDVAEARTKATLGVSSVTDEQILETTGWDKSQQGRCGVFTALGVYLGKPVDTRMNSKVGSRTEPRDFTSYGSVGLITSPVAWFSAFVGVSFWSVEDHLSDGTPIARNTRSVTFGLGTNLDVLSALFR